MIVKGELIIADKIWFNDDIHCRFRVCDFSQEQIKMLEKAKFVNISIMEHLDYDIVKVKTYISQFSNGPDSEKW